MQINSAEAHGPGMPDDVGKRDDASPALRGIHPVARPGIIGDIRLAAPPDVKAVQRMKQDGQPDAEQFKHSYEWQSAKKTNLTSVGGRSTSGGSVRDQDVFEQKCADGDNPAERVQPAQQKGVPLTCAQRAYSGLNFGRNGRSCSRCHRDYLRPPEMTR